MMNLGYNANPYGTGSQAIAKYGIDNFSKEILAVFNTEKESAELEALLVTKDFCLREDTYNMHEGGYGGFSHINDNAAKGLDYNVGSENQGQVFITNNPWNSFTSLQFPYSKKVASIPVFGIGKMYNEDKKIRVPLAIQNHHSLTDGYHIGHFLDILNRHLEDPGLIAQPFSSNFR